MTDTQLKTAIYRFTAHNARVPTIADLAPIEDPRFIALRARTGN